MPNDVKLCAGDKSGLPRVSTEEERARYKRPLPNSGHNGPLYVALAALTFAILVVGALLFVSSVSAKTDTAPPVPVKNDNPLPPTTKSDNPQPAPHNATHKGNGNHNIVVEGNGNNVGNVTHVTNNVVVINGSPGVAAPGKVEIDKPVVKVTTLPDVCEVEAERHRVRVEGWRKAVGDK
jgi:hypothetical protein